MYTLDSGQNWNTVASEPSGISTGTLWTSIAFRTNGTDVIMLVTSDEGLVYLTTDADSGSPTWTDITTTAPSPIDLDGNPKWVTCNNTGATNYIYVSASNITNGDIFRYDIGSTTWTSLSAPGPQEWARIMVSYAGDKLIGHNTNTNPGLLYVTEDATAVNPTWIQQTDINPDLSVILYTHSTVSGNGIVWGFSSDLSSGGGFEGNIYKTYAGICVSGDTTVLQFIDGQIIKKQIRDIKQGDYVIDSNNKPVRVNFNIIGGSSNKYIKISKGSLGRNIPTDDFFITDGHPIWINGKEIECQKLINNRSIKRVILRNRIQYYSLCTNERIFVMMNGLKVCTFKEEEFFEMIKKTNRPYGRQ